MSEKTKVVKIKKACEMLGCSRATFSTKYDKRLTKYKDPNGFHVYFKLEDVEALVKKLNDDNENIITDFEVVE